MMRTAQPLLRPRSARTLANCSPRYIQQSSRRRSAPVLRSSTHSSLDESWASAAANTRECIASTPRCARTVAPSSSARSVMSENGRLSSLLSR